MMGKNDRGGYYRNNAFETAGEPGSSGRIDAEITASEDSSTPTRKCININSDKWDAFGVPIQVISRSNLSRRKRKDLVHKLTSDLEQLRTLQKKIGVLRTHGVTASSSSDILSCSNGLNGPPLKSSVITCGPEKKVNPVNNKARVWNPDTSVRFESAGKLASNKSTANIILMKQCEKLLKQLMSHKYSWVFNTPVDVVKWNIPDYYTVVKHPMDLGTIKGKIASSSYSSPLEFLADVRLTFSNAMTYNLADNDVHKMADTLRKFFEARWKAIEKKLPVTKPQLLPQKSGLLANVETTNAIPPAKKRKIESKRQEIVTAPLKPVMTNQEKHNLGRELESLGEMPVHIIDFLRERTSNGRETGDDEIEIDIDDLSDDTLFTLRKLLDDYLKEKQKNLASVEPCEIELLNESGICNSSIQQGEGNALADEEIDIGGNESPVSSYPPVEIEKDTCIKSSKCASPGSLSDSDSSSSEIESDDDIKDSSPINVSKMPEVSGPGAQLDEKTSSGDPLDVNQSVSGLDQLEHTSQQKPNSVESDCCQDGDSAPNETQVSPDKLYRAALLKNRFADTILKAKEKTLSQGDPEKLRREREELELQKHKEKARLHAEAKAATEARRRAEAEAAAEARRKREVEREAARQALLKMEKTVEINGNSRFLEDLEMLRAPPGEHIPSSVDETSPEHSQDGLGSFKFGGSNPLEQLGLYMKEEEDDEEDVEPPILLNDAEVVGEID